MRKLQHGKRYAFKSPTAGRDYLNVQQRPELSAPLLCQLFLTLAG